MKPPASGSAPVPAPQPRTVALIDPLWIGHHPMYFTQFTTAFLRNGVRVIGLCPQPEEALADAHRAAAGQGIPDYAARISMHLLPAGHRSWFRGRFEGDPWRTFQRWRRAADALFSAEVETGWDSGLVFFPYLDSYLRFLPLAGVPDWTLARPWAGLYLRNHHHGDRSTPLLKHLRLLAKGDALCRSPLCRGIGVLDERFNDALSRYTGQPVLSFPDVTDTVLPAEPTALARAVIDKAAGRRIIGLIGLEKRKGLLTLLQVAAEARAQKRPWYFVCAGHFGRSLFTPQEQAGLDALAQAIATGEVDNVHFDPAAGRIPDEAGFNSLFRTFDIAWTAYEGFQGSSGALSKAAAFEIPSLATAGECIGHRVGRYRTGVTIPEGDAGQALVAIERLLAGLDLTGTPLQPDYAAFREAHGQPRLDELLAEVIGAE